MSGLVWGIKQSLLAYVRGMPDGEALVEDGATLTHEGGLLFSRYGDLSFRGTVTLVGHNGMMRVVLRDPQIERDGESWILSIADPDESDGRLRFATVGSFDINSGRGTRVALTADGADLFFGPYIEGTPLDDLVITTCRWGTLGRNPQCAPPTDRASGPR